LILLYNYKKQIESNRMYCNCIVIVDGLHITFFFYLLMVI